MGSATSTLPAGHVVQDEAGAGVHLDRLFRRRDAVAEPAVDGRFRGGQGGHRQALLPCQPQFLGHHAAQQPAAAVRGPHGHGSHEPGVQEAAEANVQRLGHRAERRHRHVGAECVVGDGPGLVGAGHHAPVGALHLDALVDPFVAAAGVVEAEGDGPHPGDRLRVGRVVLGRRLETPDLILLCHELLPLNRTRLTATGRRGARCPGGHGAA